MKQSLQLWLYVLAIFIDSFGFSLVVVIFAPIIIHNSAHLFANHLPLSDRNMLLGCLLAIYSLGQFLGSSLWGSFSDKLGRKKILLTTLTLSALSYVITALALCFSSLIFLFVSRFLAGFFAGNMTLAQAGIADISTNENRTSNMALISVAGSLAYILGPFIGGRLSNDAFVSWFNVETPFWITAIIFFLITVFIASALKESYKPETNRKMELFKNFNAIREVASHPRLKYLFLTFFLARFGFWMFLLFFSAFLVEKFSLTQIKVTDVFIYLALWMLVLQFTLVKWLGKRCQLPFLIKLTAFLLAAIIALIGFAPTLSVLYILIPIWAFAAGGFYTYITSYLSVVAGKDNQGKAMGIALSLQGLVQMLAPLVAGLSITGHVTLPFMLGGMLVFIALMVFIRQTRA